MTSGTTLTVPVISAMRGVPRGVEIDLVPPADLLYFQGHFPGRPILPGVVQIDWALRFADRYLGTALGAATDFRVKFTSVIEPRMHLTLTLQRSENGRNLNFAYRAGDNTVSTGAIALANVP